MVTARGSVSPCPLSSRERAILRAAQERVERVLAQGMTAEERAQVIAELQEPPATRQGALALRRQS